MEELCDYIPSRIAALISAFLGNVSEIITNAVALSKDLSYFILIALLGGCVANGLFLMGSCIIMSEHGFPRKKCFVNLLTAYSEDAAGGLAKHEWGPNEDKPYIHSDEATLPKRSCACTGYSTGAI